MRHAHKTTAICDNLQLEICVLRQVRVEPHARAPPSQHQRLVLMYSHYIGTRIISLNASYLVSPSAPTIRTASARTSRTITSRSRPLFAVWVLFATDLTAIAVARPTAFISPLLVYADADVRYSCSYTWYNTSGVGPLSTQGLRLHALRIRLGKCANSSFLELSASFLSGVWVQAAVSLTAVSEPKRPLRNRFRRSFEAKRLKAVAVGLAIY
jgi:hypothetical protein